MDEKERIEREALAYFLRLYNRQNKSRFQLAVKRERPDFEIEDKLNGDHYGVEIAHIFHDKKEAMMILGRDESKIHGIITAQDHVKVLTEVLRNKAEKVKHYPFKGPMILVIRDFSYTFDVRHLFDQRLGLKVPVTAAYKEIWYLGRSRPVKKWDVMVQIK